MESKPWCTPGGRWRKELHLQIFLSLENMPCMCEFVHHSTFSFETREASTFSSFNCWNLSWILLGGSLFMMFLNRTTYLVREKTSIKSLENQQNKKNQYKIYTHSLNIYVHRENKIIYYAKLVLIQWHISACTIVITYRIELIEWFLYSNWIIIIILLTTLWLSIFRVIPPISLLFSLLEAPLQLSSKFQAYVITLNSFTFTKLNSWWWEESVGSDIIIVHDFFPDF